MRKSLVVSGVSLIRDQRASPRTTQTRRANVSLSDATTTPLDIIVDSSPVLKSLHESSATASRTKGAEMGAYS